MATNNQQALGQALAALETGVKREITAPKAYARHLANKAELERIHRQDAEAIKTAPGYSAAMGCFLSPKAEVAFINSQREADRASAPALRMAAE